MRARFPGIHPARCSASLAALGGWVWSLVYDHSTSSTALSCETLDVLPASFGHKMVDGVIQLALFQCDEAEVVVTFGVAVEALDEQAHGYDSG
jgi:hypothetical protein